MINFESLHRLYVVEGKSVRECASDMNSSRSTVAFWVKKQGWSRRREPRASKMSEKVLRVSPDERFVHYLDGLIVSDGFLGVSSNRQKTAFYSQTSIDREWLSEIRDRFTLAGIPGTLGESFRKDKNKWEFSFRSSACDWLYPQWSRWYGGEKRVPEDIVLCQEFLKNWVYGDGTLISGNSLRLCTDGFSEIDIDSLQERLNRDTGCVWKKLYMGEAKTGKPKYRLSLCRRDGLEKFFITLGSPLNCFRRKWI